jgi:hypothetical protein
MSRKALLIAACLIVSAIPASAQTRFYLPSTTVADASPAFSATWNATSGAVRRKTVTTASSTADATHTIDPFTATTPELTLFRQYVSDPIDAQTLSPGGAWTAKGQIRCVEETTGVNAGLAIGIRVVSNDGSTVRGTLLDVTAADALGALECDADATFAALENRQFVDAAETSTLELAEVVASAGDRIVIEIGIRDASTSTTTGAALSFGDDGTGDLGENSTDTTATNPWVQLSGTVAFQSAASNGRGKLCMILRLCD